MYDVKFIKVWAIGYYSSYAWIIFDDKEVCIHIPRSLYHYLRSCGVPTSQSLRGKK